MKKELLKKGIRIFMVVGFILTVIGVGQSSAQLINRGYQFGPGTGNLVSSTQSINVPARSTVTVAVSLQRTFIGANGLAAADVPVAIDILPPGSSAPVATQFANATVVNAGLQIPVVTFPGIFTSQRGCPNTWRVRIRTSNNAAAAVRVFGSVAFAIIRPGVTNIDMQGGETLNLNNGASTTRVLAGQNLVGGLDNAVIAGTGVFNIKAKWHTDPADIFNFGKFFRVLVELLRPNGTVAASQRNFSQHKNSGKLSFSYSVTAADAALPGTWKVRITNSSGQANVTNARIVDFDIERGFDALSPAFSSTFTPQCTGNI
ncbi:MAG TPA: hypothetical protein VF721_17135 [Pyrinomonadaceae bacterium]|jgi:hypothetical protein